MPRSLIEKIKPFIPKFTPTEKNVISAMFLLFLTRLTPHGDKPLWRVCTLFVLYSFAFDILEHLKNDSPEDMPAELDYQPFH